MDYIKAVGLQVIHFFDKNAPAPNGKLGREIILMYSLGEDGIVREFANGKWAPMPIPADEYPAPPPTAPDTRG